MTVSTLHANLIETRALVHRESKRLGKEVKSADFLLTEAPQVNFSLEQIADRFSKLSTDDPNVLAAKAEFIGIMQIVKHSHILDIAFEYKILESKLDRAASYLSKADPSIVLGVSDFEPLQNAHFDMDLTVVSDGIEISTLATNQYTVSECADMLQLLEDIETGRTNIQIVGNKKFRSLIIDCFKKILTRREGIAFVRELISHPEIPINIDQKASTTSQCFGYYYHPSSNTLCGARSANVIYKDGKFYHTTAQEDPSQALIPHSVKIGLKKSEGLLFEKTSGGLGRSKEDQSWLALLHELIHGLHFMEGGWHESRSESKGSLTSKSMYSDEEEEITIRGLLPNGHRTIWSENLFRTIFKMAPRKYHIGGVEPFMMPEAKIDHIFKLKSFSDFINFMLERGEGYPSINEILKKAIELDAPDEMLNLLIYLVDPDTTIFPKNAERLLDRYYPKLTIEKIKALRDESTLMKSRIDLINWLRKNSPIIHVDISKQLKVLEHLNLRGGDPFSGPTAKRRKLLDRLYNFMIDFSRRTSPAQTSEYQNLMDYQFILDRLINLNHKFEPDFIKKLILNGNSPLLSFILLKRPSIINETLVGENKTPILIHLIKEAPTHETLTNILNFFIFYSENIVDLSLVDQDGITLHSLLNQLAVNVEDSDVERIDLDGKVIYKKDLSNDES